MKSRDTAIKKVKGFSSAYPNMCNLKLLPNIDGTWVTIQDDIGTSMTIKLSDLSGFIRCEHDLSVMDIDYILEKKEMLESEE